MARRTQAQADFALFRTIFDEEEKLRKEQNRIEERERKKGSRSGLGSILGAIIAALATGGSSLAVTGLATGLGSRLGSEVGERSVRGSSQVGGDFLFNQPQIRQQNFDQRQLDREFNQGQTADAIFKGISGAALQGLSGGASEAGFSQAGTSIGTGGGVGVTGNVLRAGSREALTSGLGQQGRGAFGRGILGRTAPGFSTGSIDKLIRLILGL